MRRVSQIKAAGSGPSTTSGPGPPPAPGVDSHRGWWCVAATFASSFVTLGITYSFGAFFASMAAEFETSQAATSVIFGLTTFGFFWMSILTGRAADRFGPRPVLAAGTVALFVSLIATSRAQSLLAGYLTYGLGMGFAAATGYVPMVAVVGAWFERQRATAVGISVAGIGAGTLVMSPLSATLIEAYGWRRTYVLFALGGTAVLCLCVLAVQRPPVVAGTPTVRLTDSLRSPVFRQLWISAICSGLALFIPFVYVGQYARERGASPLAAATLVGVLGGASILARIGFGPMVARFGSLVLYRFSFALLATSFVVWAFAGSSFVVLLAFVSILGFGYGGFVALSTIVLAERMGVVGLGATLGLFYTSQGLGGLIGPPVAGWILDSTGEYRLLAAIGATLCTAALLLLVGLPQNQDAR